MFVNKREVDIFGFDCVGAAELVAKDKVDPVVEMGRDVVTFQYPVDNRWMVISHEYCCS